MDKPMPAPLYLGTLDSSTGAPDALEHPTGICLYPGDCFTLSAQFRISDGSGSRVLLEKGPKDLGHYLLKIEGGELVISAPDFEGGTEIRTGIIAADGRRHHMALTYRRPRFCVYFDGILLADREMYGVPGTCDCVFGVKGLNQGTLLYSDILENVSFIPQTLTHRQIADSVPDEIYGQNAYTPVQRISTYAPDKFVPDGPLRGIKRINEPAALPFLDPSATVGYCGSIAKDGSNADYEWHIYQDQRQEWVLFETYGAGCLFNFTQHRYPTSPEPTFRFYLDDPDVPAYEIRQSEFGKKAPFLSPMSDIYEGPTENGRGPIWVIRSFVPMEFTRYCKVTSDIYLTGFEKIKGEGGWGHVTYTTHDQPGTLKTFTVGDAQNQINWNKVNNLRFDPKCSAENCIHSFENLTVVPSETTPVFTEFCAGSIGAVKLWLEGRNALPEVLTELRLRLIWDESDSYFVDAPVGTFFGCEYGALECDNAMMMIGTEIAPGRYFRGYNYFPMPFWKSVRAELYTAGEVPIQVSRMEIQITPESVIPYPKEKCGYFVSSKYYPMTNNIRGQNTLIGQIDGTGHMVYGVLSGQNIWAGCEGDVRVLFDGRRSPEIESDGSESWSSYGWGFVTPPECNPFSGYNGIFNSNADWCEVRTTIGDSYFFKTSLRFELEHGCENDGMGSHSGQFFCYLAQSPKAAVTDTIVMEELDSLTSHSYHVDGEYETETVHSAHANGRNMHRAFTQQIHKNFTAPVSFRLTVDPDNRGVVLLRTASQALGRQGAKVFVDGTEVTEKIWYAADSNPIYLWRDDSFQIPAKYTQGKERIMVTLEPMDFDGNHWNAAQFTAISIL